jgi:hypothetical protein
LPVVFGPNQPLTRAMRLARAGIRVLTPAALPERWIRASPGRRSGARSATQSLARARRPAGGEAPPPAESGPKPSAAWCSASASRNSRYDDYDVDIHSNQPDQYATVTGVGRTAGYDTNGSGYADVYFHASRHDAGDEINVQVGRASCSTAL